MGASTAKPSGATVILIVVGPAPGALSAPEIAREISAAGHDVEVILNSEARLFVGPSAFAGVGNTVEKPSLNPEVVIFAPAEAGVLARLAYGMDGFDFGDAPVLAVPDLDPETAKHPAVAGNIEALRRDGVRVVEGDGSGMASSHEISAVVLGNLGGPMAGMKVLVTAGGTRERIDSVRFIGNRSSGRMGVALARKASRLGADVTLVAANINSREPGVEWVPVESVEEMKGEVMGRVGDSDVLIMAAAVSDFTPAEVGEKKIRRGGSDRMTLELVSTSDILGAVRSRNENLFVIGFAATHGDPVPDAREKLRKKGADIIVGNDISQAGIGFDSEENEVCVVGRDGVEFIPRASKDEVARSILDASLMEMDKLDKEKR